MQLSVDQLVAHVQRTLAPVYLVYGEEPLLIQEAADRIRDAARAQGFAERQVFSVEAGFDWPALTSSTQSLSLFAERRVIELRLPTGKPGETGTKALVALADQTSPDTLLLVLCGKLERAQRETKWFKALDGAGVVVPIYGFERAQLPRWITARFAARGLKAGAGVAELLAHHMEGNLLAAAQEIDKIAMAFGAGATVSVDDIEDSLCDNARFNVFGLADTCLRGEAAAVTRMLAGLRAEGGEPVLILWALAREVRELAQMADEVARGRPLAGVIEARRVWPKRRALVTQALQRLPARAWPQLLQRAARVDRVIKGRRAGQVWQELECLALALTGTRLRTCA
jgi:DNA polymerase-3 subunit delta